MLKSAQVPREAERKHGDRHRQSPLQLAPSENPAELGAEEIVQRRRELGSEVDECWKSVVVGRYSANPSLHSAATVHFNLWHYI